MNTEHIDRRGVPPWTILLVAVLALVVATAALTAIIIRPTLSWSGTMMSGGQPGLMAGGGMMGRGFFGTNRAQPGEAGFVAGTVAVPRVVRIAAGPRYTFTPSTVAVARGETVTFVVTAMGPAIHEFMVGPANEVAADSAGTPEVADISMMQSKSLTYTFDGSGPYAFACHAAGHYEAGMHGTITLVG
jgi:plastocyanin